MPKSASSFLTLAVGSLPGMKIKAVCISGGRNEQNLDPTVLSYRDFTAYVAQHHVRFGETTESLIAEFRLAPVVLTRNLADVLMSVRDHCRNEDWKGPAVWLVEDHVHLPDRQFEDLLADLMLPWYVSFYVGWKSCPSAIWATYDEVRTEPEQLLKRISNAAAIRCTEADIERAVKLAIEDMPRFNKGVSGRGRALSPYARSRIEKLLAHYPDVDFEPIWPTRQEQGRGSDGPDPAEP